MTVNTNGMSNWEIRAQQQFARGVFDGANRHGPPTCLSPEYNPAYFAGYKQFSPTPPRREIGLESQRKRDFSL